MKKGLCLCLCVLFLCGCGPRNAEEAQENAAMFLNGDLCEITPDLQSLSGRVSGGIFDSTAENLPTVLVEDGDEWQIHFLQKAPKSVSVQKYDIYDTKDALGAASARSEAMDIAYTYQENQVSFALHQGESDCQLVLVTCQWPRNHIRYGWIVSFTTEKDGI